MNDGRVMRRGTALRMFSIGAATVAASGATASAQAKWPVAALFAGSVTDGGFMQAGFDGLNHAHDTFGVNISFVQGVAPQLDPLSAALRSLAAKSPAMIVTHGGQNSAAAKAVATEFPKIAFVVTQGNVLGTNLASYEVLQEQSAFLAGALAGLTTKTGVVAHLSGIKVVPGLKGRAAYAAGVKMVNPQATLLTTFCGSQDDVALAQKVTLAMADAKADVVFTMLNAGRTGAIDACRDRHVAQIGNVVDWVARMPAVFVGSAVADSGIAVYAAIEDLVNGRFKPGVLKQIGLERPDAVRLTIRPDVPASVRTKIAALSADIAAGKLVVPTDWTGTEFSPPA